MKPTSRKNDWVEVHSSRVNAPYRGSTRPSSTYFARRAFKVCTASRIACSSGMFVGLEAGYFVQWRRTAASVLASVKITPLAMPCANLVETSGFALTKDAFATNIQLRGFEV